MQGQHDYLHIYLTDHYAASVAARRLIERMLGKKQEDGLVDFLRRLMKEITKDAEECLEVIKALDLSASPVKNALAQVGERLGRLKLNGHFVSYSPLSRLFELEGLAMGISGKRKLWETLSVVQQRDSRLERFDFWKFQARADEQLAEVSKWHGRATQTVLDEQRQSATEARAHG